MLPETKVSSKISITSLCHLPQRATRAFLLSLVNMNSTVHLYVSLLSLHFRLDSTHAFGHQHLSSPPAIAMTLAPFFLPIWHTREPVAPAAPLTTKVSPALILPTSRRPYTVALRPVDQEGVMDLTKYAVRPVRPRGPRKSTRLEPLGGLISRTRSV
jgi:hypothetical protein